VDLKTADSDGWNAAMLAAYKGRLRCLELCRDAGVDLNATSNDGWTAAMHAAENDERECHAICASAAPITSLSSAAEKGWQESIVACLRWDAPDAM
jgi:ankyrin repeat protein